MRHGQLPISELLDKLRLTGAKHAWEDTAERARNEGWSREEFLTVLLLQELNHQQVTRLHLLCQSARFPFQKTANDFDFRRVSPQCEPVIGACLEREFVSSGRSLVLVGEPGSGKTHLAVAVALQALRNGFDALYTRADDLLTSLGQAVHSGQWREAMSAYTRPDVLIIDDVTGGHLQENHLFLLLNERYLAKRSIILTTRLLPEQRERASHEGLLIEAILARLVERGQLLYLDSARRTDPAVVELSEDDLADSFGPAPLPVIDTPAKEPGSQGVLVPLRAVSHGERRSHQRYQVSIEVNARSPHNFFSGFCRDISEGGIFLATQEPQPVGSLIDLKFSLPSGHIVCTSGVVRWQRSCRQGGELPGVGVEFLALSPEDLAAIHEFFKQRDPMFLA